MTEKPDEWLDPILNEDIPREQIENEREMNGEDFEYNPALFAQHHHRKEFCEPCGGKLRLFAEGPDGIFRCPVCGSD